jgi:hypothetical protein
VRADQKVLRNPINACDCGHCLIQILCCLELGLLVQCLFRHKQLVLQQHSAPAIAALLVVLEAACVPVSAIGGLIPVLLLAKFEEGRAKEVADGPPLVSRHVGRLGAGRIIPGQVLSLLPLLLLLEVEVVLLVGLVVLVLVLVLVVGLFLVLVVLVVLVVLLALQLLTLQQLTLLVLLLLLLVLLLLQDAETRCEQVLQQQLLLQQGLLQHVLLDCTGLP